MLLKKRGTAVILLSILSLWLGAGELSPVHALAPQGATNHNLDLASFDTVWSTLGAHYWDRSMSGLDWQQIRREYRPRVEASRSIAETRKVIEAMMRRLPSSHLALLPREIYPKAGQKPQEPALKEQAPKEKAGEEPDANEDDEASVDTATAGLTFAVIDGHVVVESVEPEGGAASGGVRPGWILLSAADVSFADPGHLFSPDEPLREIKTMHLAEEWFSGSPGQTVSAIFRVRNEDRSVSVRLQEPQGRVSQFGNLPPEHVRLEHHRTPGGMGYLQLNIFLDPVYVMTELQHALAELDDCRGMVLDLRNNPGGIGMMASGIAGFFIDQEGYKLGTMQTREMAINFVVNPRASVYSKPLAVLVNAGSASTSEILAQGLHDIGRAKVVGTRTAGAALPSIILRLPNGDAFQYPQATYRSVLGRNLEGNGVQPDLEASPTIDALLSGHDLPLEAAIGAVSAVAH